MLGAAGYGMYALAISTMEFAARLTQLGLPNGVVRFVALYQAEKNWGKLKGTLFTSLGLGTIIGGIGGIGLFFAAPWIGHSFFHDPDLVRPIQAAALALPMYNLVMIVQSILRGGQHMTSFTYVGILRQGATLLLAVLLVGVGFGALGAVGGFALGAFIAFLWGIQSVIRSLPSTIWRMPTIWRTRELLAFSLPLYLAGFSFLLMSRVDIIMLGYFSTTTEVGIYRGAVALARLVVFALGAINVVFAPMIADLYHKNAFTELKTLFQTVARWSTIISLAIALPLVLFARDIMGIYGKDFQRGALPLYVLVTGQVINAGIGTSVPLLQMTNHPKHVLVNSLVATVTNIALNALLIQRLGALGAAIATSLALVINSLMGTIESYIMFKIHPIESKFLLIVIPVLGTMAVYLGLSSVNIIWMYKAVIVSIIFLVLAFIASTSNTEKQAVKTIVLRTSKILP